MLSGAELGQVHFDSQVHGGRKNRDGIGNGQNAPFTRA